VPQLLYISRGAEYYDQHRESESRILSVKAQLLHADSVYQVFLNFGTVLSLEWV